ncbi:MAG: tyrosine-protein phosphatase [Propionicimonas sp.]|uniref:tyrosine-protein phosphatase n=1 Tax=Propionicimonas sp. TaxID=1955623 RepID=UPI003D0DA2D6
MLSALVAGVLASGCTTEPTTPASTSATPGVETPATGATTPAATATATATATPTSTASVVPTLAVGSVSNFRDVAGDGLALPDGGHLATGVVYRSAKLSTASTADLRRLSNAGIELVIDLRTPYVASRSPDPAIKGADHRMVNIYAVTRSPTVTYRTVAAARAHMRRLNVDFVADPAQRAKIGEALELIASADGPVVVHCTEGKDRTGWISAMLQYIAGADDEQVLAEYLKSNEYRAGLLSSTFARTRRTRGLTAARIERALLRVESGYLGAGLDEVAARYGDIDTYLTEGVGLSAATVKELRRRLVVA